MPDFERVLRKLEVDIQPTPQLKAEVKAYHRGMDRARYEILIISSIVIVVTVLISFN